MCAACGRPTLSRYCHMFAVIKLGIYYIGICTDIIARENESDNGSV